MFHLESYASQFALLHLVEHLWEKGLGWLDIQMLTPHMERMGAIEVSREGYLERLQREQESVRELFP